MTAGITLKLSKPQSEAYRALKPRTTLCFPWGRGTGKSFFLRTLWYLLVAEWSGKVRPGAPHEGVRIVLVMPTLEQAKKVHRDLMVAELDTLGDWGFLGAQIDRTHWRIRFPGGSWIQWVSAERARNIRGMRCDVVCIDEADDIDASLIDAIAVPWFSEPHSLKMMFVCGTPTRGKEGLLYRTHKRGLDGVAGFWTRPATYKDVPEFVDVKWVEESVKPNTPPELFAREWEADFSAAEGTVYRFLPEFHVVPSEQYADTTFGEYLVGVDWGWEDPGVFLVIGVNGHGRDARCHVIEEVYEQHRAPEWWAEKAREIGQRYPGAKWYADPSQPMMIESLRTSAHVNIRGSVKHEILDGVATLQDLMMVRSSGEPGTPEYSEYSRFYVSSACPNTIRELQLYRRKKDAREKDSFQEAIEDRWNHCADAGRYAIFSRFGKPPSVRRVRDASELYDG